MPFLDTDVFAKIIAREIPSDIVFETDRMITFKDINPKAKIHIIIVPKEALKTAKEVEEKKGEGEILFGSEIELLPEVVYGYLDIELRSMMTIVADYSGILERDEKKMMGAVRGLQRAAEQKKLNIDVIGMYQNLKEGYSARKVANEPYTINPVWAMNNWCLDNLKRTIESKLEQKRLEK